MVDDDIASRINVEVNRTAIDTLKAKVTITLTDGSAKTLADSDTSDHRFRRYPIIHSNFIRSPIPVISDHALAHFLALF